MRKQQPINIKRLQAVAAERGGQCLSEEYQGVRVKHRWRCREGHTWEVAPFGILYNGQWCRQCKTDREKKEKPRFVDYERRRAAIPTAFARKSSPMPPAKYIPGGKRKWKHGDIHPETGKVFWSYDLSPPLKDGSRPVMERWLSPEAFEHRRMRKLLRQRQSKRDNRPPEHLRTLKQGDVHPTAGKVFWAYDRTHKNGEYWLSPESFARMHSAGRKNKKQEHRQSKRRETERARIKHDTLFKLTKRLRTQIRNALRTYASDAGRSYLLKTLGCSLEELKIHLEKQFSEGMTWANHGRGANAWHIDHIVPLASASTREEVLHLCHYTNLQPLWERDNILKGAIGPDGKNYGCKPYQKAWRKKALEDKATSSAVSPYPPRSLS
jgi:hypothetical protein